MIINKSDIEKLIEERVHEYYWQDDINCATATIKILSELANIKINQQVINGAIGLHGAGGFGAQCGLVEGSLLFIGILGRHKKVQDDEIIKACNRFADAFQKHFGCLLCSSLRPEGTSEHLCEKLTQDAIKFSAEFILTEYKKINFANR